MTTFLQIPVLQAAQCGLIAAIRSISYQNDAVFVISVTNRIPVSVTSEGSDRREYPTFDVGEFHRRSGDPSSMHCMGGPVKSL